MIVSSLRIYRRKSIRESSNTSTTAGNTLGNNMTGSTASASSTSSSYRRPTDLNNISMTTSTTGPTTNDSYAAVGGSGIPGDIKPRSLRFTWSMKTTSAMDPADMMKEIRKVNLYYFCSLFVHSIVDICIGPRY